MKRGKGGMHFFCVPDCVCMVEDTFTNKKKDFDLQEIELEEDSERSEDADSFFF